jgi:hypothetical protein
MHQQLWGYKVEWKSVSRGTGGKKVEYHCSRRDSKSWRHCTSGLRPLWIRQLLHQYFSKKWSAPGALLLFCSSTFSFYFIHLLFIFCSSFNRSATLLCIDISHYSVWILFISLFFCKTIFFITPKLTVPSFRLETCSACLPCHINISLSDGGFLSSFTRPYLLWMPNLHISLCSFPYPVMSCVDVFMYLRFLGGLPIFCLLWYVLYVPKIKIE